MNRLYLSVALCALPLSGCSTMHRWFDSSAPVTPAPVPGASHATSPLAAKQYDTICTGKLVAISDKEMIVETKEDVLFIDITKQDKERLKAVNKGDIITLRGKVTPAAGGKAAESDVEDVLLKNGSDIPLE